MQPELLVLVRLSALRKGKQPNAAKFEIPNFIPPYIFPGTVKRNHIETMIDLKNRKNV
jgi:hypothetical protein